ncbi:hypothetical protein CW748_10530 [Alteromonadales bacterium alter-6D02]|nr:hypothetical protein CW748_10530 [Alteromonadales bacterium alter-6D02]
MEVTQKFLSLHQSLTDIGHHNGTLSEDTDELIEKVLKTCADKLAVGRVSLWYLSPSNEQLICQKLYALESQHFDAGHVIERDYCPKYFQRLLEQEICYCENVEEYDFLSELLSFYFQPLNIKSILEVPIFAEGAFKGVLCIEQTATTRHWDVADMAYAASIAEILSLTHVKKSWRAALRQLSHLEQIDPLTNLENRLFFDKRIRQSLASAGEDYPCAVILIGIDNFTAVNDNFGYLFANNVLCKVANRMENLKSNEVFFPARVDGDVFGVWLPNQHNELKLEPFLLLLKALFLKPFMTPGGELVSLSASIGVMVSNKSDLVEQDPIRRAEQAMVKGKENNPGVITYFKPEWLEQHQQTLKFEREFNDALTSGQIVPHYQPILNRTYQQDGIRLEALVRWVHPMDGLIAPFKFLPLAKRLGLMQELGDVVIEQVCKDINILIAEGLPLLSVAVNVSSEQLLSPTFCQRVEELLTEYEIAPSLIEIEIVEELIAGDSTAINKQLDSLSELGLKLSIDDFGTGYSSLSRLKNFNISKLKIDKSFVDGILTSEEDICIARSIIGLAKGMRIEIVAEGVETKAQAEWLLEHGCDFLQGYLFSKPIAPSELFNFFSAESAFPTFEPATYHIDNQSSVMAVKATGIWEGQITQRCFREVEAELIKAPQPKWAFYIDATEMDVGTLDFQYGVKQGIGRLKQHNLRATVFLVSNNDLVRYQLEILNVETPDYQRRIFTDANLAHEWLVNHGYIHGSES